MGLRLKAFALGTVEVNPVDTASNVSVNVQAANGVLSYADSTTGGLFCQQVQLHSVLRHQRQVKCDLTLLQGQ
jgi:hypothetical protein